MKTRVKMLQHNRLDANSFVLVKLGKNKKKLHQYYCGCNTNFRKWRL